MSAEPETSFQPVSPRTAEKPMAFNFGEFKGGAFRGPKHMTWLYLTVVVAVASLVLFALGSFASVSALSQP